MEKYFYFFKLSFFQSLSRKGSTVGRIVFFATILFIFSRLWKEIGLKADLPFSLKDSIWYLVLTEWIVLSMPLVNKMIDEDVVGGGIAYFLTRPTNYIWNKFYEALGIVFVRMIILFFAGTIFGYLFSGGWPSSEFKILFFIPLGIISVIFITFCQLTIGLTSFWILDSMPLYWIFQKFMFIFGGMMLPLSIYPEWMQEIANVLPFSRILYYPAKMGITGDLSLYAMSLIHITLWTFIIGLTMHLLFKLVSKKVTILGG